MCSRHSHRSPSRSRLPSVTRGPRSSVITDCSATNTSKHKTQTYPPRRIFQKHSLLEPSWRFSSHKWASTSYTLCAGDGDRGAKPWNFNSHSPCPHDIERGTGEQDLMPEEMLRRMKERDSRHRGLLMVVDVLTPKARSGRCREYTNLSAGLLYLFRWFIPDFSFFF